MSERTDISFDAALMMALRADAQRELDSLPTPKQFEEIYPDTSQWDERMTEALKKKKHHPVLKRVLIAALTLVMLTVGALAVSADFRRAVYTMIQKFLPIEMQLTYQVDGEPLEWLPDGYSDHYVPNGFEMDDVQKFERAENFLHVYSSKETEESYTVRCSIIQPGQQSLFDNEHTTKRMRIALIIQRLLMGAKKRRCMSMSKKRLLSIVVSAVILLSFACTAMAAEKSERYVGDSTVNGSIYQTYYQVDAQTRTGVKKISVSGVLYEKGTIGTWQKVSSCSNSSTTSTCMVSSSFNTKPGKSYRLEYSATFSYSDGRSETITGSTSR